MSANISITAFGPKDGKFCKMKAIRDACKELVTDEPDEVMQYFNALDSVLLHAYTDIGQALTSNPEGSEMLIDVSLIPAGVAMIRVKLE